MKRPCIFFDRDGIVNTAPPPEEYYVLSVDRFFIEPGFVNSLRVLKEKGWPAVIVTNQQAVHKGLLTQEDLDAIHRHLEKELAVEGLALLGIYVCPHGEGHPDRKPKPGMLLRAAADHDLDLSRSWMIGDSPRDMEAGKAARTAFNLQVSPGKPSPFADDCIGSMDLLPAYLRRHLS